MEPTTKQNMPKKSDDNSSKVYDAKSAKEKLAEKFKHINGWGIDADPENEPTYPMKKYTGDDHRRSNYERPPQQPVDVEVLHSNERPTVSAVFGDRNPPKGLSGVLRRKAFKYSEESLKHWFILVMADRVNVVEGLIEDFSKGHVPNVFAEMGWGAGWKYNKKVMVKKVVIITAVTAVALLWLNRKKLSRS